MARISHLLGLLCVMPVAVVAQTTAGAWEGVQTVNSAIGVGANTGTVAAFVDDPARAGSYFVCGTFRAIGGVVASSVAYYNSSSGMFEPLTTRPWGGLKANYTNGVGSCSAIALNGTQVVMAIRGLCGGGVNMYPGICVFDTVSRNFTALGSVTASLYTPAINTLAVTGSGGGSGSVLWVGGVWDACNGVASVGACQWSDGRWLGMRSGAQLGIDRIMYRMVPIADGVPLGGTPPVDPHTVLACGTFTRVGAAPSSRVAIVAGVGNVTVMQLRPAGATGNGLNEACRAAVPGPNGRWFLGGSFTLATGAGGAGALFAPRIVAWDSVFSRFMTVTNSLPTTPGVSVEALAFDPTYDVGGAGAGTIFIAGAFTRLNNSVSGPSMGSLVNGLLAVSANTGVNVAFVPPPPAMGVPGVQGSGLPCSDSRGGAACKASALLNLGIGGGRSLLVGGSFEQGASVACAHGQLSPLLSSSHLS